MGSSEHAPTQALLHNEAMARSAFGRLLRDLPPYQLVAEAEGPAAFKRAFALGTPPKAIVLGLESAMADECAMLRWLLHQMPDARNVLLGPEPPVATLVRAVRAGAHGLCCTRRHPERLRSVLDLVCAGALAFPKCMEDYLRDHLPEPVQQVEQELTERQSRLLVLVGRTEDLTYEAIATEMKLSVARVKEIAARLCVLYKVSGKTGLVHVGIRLGLVAA